MAFLRASKRAKILEGVLNPFVDKEGNPEYHHEILLLTVRDEGSSLKFVKLGGVLQEVLFSFVFLDVSLFNHTKVKEMNDIK